jgi:hypothetical protein
MITTIHYRNNDKKINNEQNKGEKSNTVLLQQYEYSVLGYRMSFKNNYNYNKNNLHSNERLDN